MHQIFTPDVLRRLRANGEAHLKTGRVDPLPVVKIYNAFSSATWMLTESDPSDPDHLYGLADLGQGHPELGYVSRHEIESCVVRVGGCQLPLERDGYFEPVHTIAVYTRAARIARRITENPESLDRAAAQIQEERSRTKLVPAADAGWQDWPATP